MVDCLHRLRGQGWLCCGYCLLWLVSFKNTSKGRRVKGLIKKDSVNGLITDMLPIAFFLEIRTTGLRKSKALLLQHILKFYSFGQNCFLFFPLRNVNFKKNKNKNKKPSSFILNCPRISDSRHRSLRITVIEEIAVICWGQRLLF